MNEAMTKRWKGKTAVVTGGAGMTGSYLSELLLEAGAKVVVVDDLSAGRREWVPEGATLVVEDLRLGGAAALLLKHEPEAVFHLAAHVSGITYNEHNHARMLIDNGLLQLGMLEAISVRPTRLINFSTACVLPHDAPIPTPEDAAMGDGPEPTNRGYGWGKRIGEMGADDLMTEDTRQSILTIRPWNQYSERDHFDDPDAHVIPALIMKMLRGRNPLRVRGTGKARRSFIHARDAAMATLLAEAAGAEGIVHIGSKEEISIADLVKLLVDATGYKGEIVWDDSKEDGYSRRLSDPRRMDDLIGRSPMPGWRPEVVLGLGLHRIVKAARNWMKQAETAPSAS